MNSWIYVHYDTKEEIDRDIAPSMESLDIIGEEDVFICPNNVPYEIIGSYKVVDPKRDRVDKILLCERFSPDDEKEKKTYFR